MKASNDIQETLHEILKHKHFDCELGTEASTIQVKEEILNTLSSFHYIENQDLRDQSVYKEESNRIHLLIKLDSEVLVGHKIVQYLYEIDYKLSLNRDDVEVIKFEKKKVTELAQIQENDIQSPPTKIITITNKAHCEVK